MNYTNFSRIFNGDEQEWPPLEQSLIDQLSSSSSPSPQPAPAATTSSTTTTPVSAEEVPPEPEKKKVATKKVVNGKGLTSLEVTEDPLANQASGMTIEGLACSGTVMVFMSNTKHFNAILALTTFDTIMICHNRLNDVRSDALKAAVASGEIGFCLADMRGFVVDLTPHDSPIDTTHLDESALHSSAPERSLMTSFAKVTDEAALRRLLKRTYISLDRYGNTKRAALQMANGKITAEAVEALKYDATRTVGEIKQLRHDNDAKRATASVNNCFAEILLVDENEHSRVKIRRNGCAIAKSLREAKNSTRKSTPKTSVPRKRKAKEMEASAEEEAPAKKMDALLDVMPFSFESTPRLPEIDASLFDDALLKNFVNDDITVAASTLTVLCEPLNANLIADEWCRVRMNTFDQETLDELVSLWNSTYSRMSIGELRSSHVGMLFENQTELKSQHLIDAEAFYGQIYLAHIKEEHRETVLNNPTRFSKRFTNYLATIYKFSCDFTKLKTTGLAIAEPIEHEAFVYSALQFGYSRDDAEFFADTFNEPYQKLEDDVFRIAPGDEALFE